MHVSEYVSEKFLEELAFLCRETFEKLLQPVTYLKMLLFHRYFSAIFDPFQTFFSAFQQITLVPLKLDFRLNSL